MVKKNSEEHAHLQQKYSCLITTLTASLSSSSSINTTKLVNFASSLLSLPSSSYTTLFFDYCLPNNPFSIPTITRIIAKQKKRKTSNKVLTVLYKKICATDITTTTTTIVTIANTSKKYLPQKNKKQKTKKRKQKSSNKEQQHKVGKKVEKKRIKQHESSGTNQKVVKDFLNEKTKKRDTQVEAGIGKIMRRMIMIRNWKYQENSKSKSFHPSRNHHIKTLV